MAKRDPIRPATSGEPFEGYSRQNQIRDALNARTPGGIDRDINARIQGGQDGPDEQEPRVIPNPRVATGHVKKWDPETARNLDQLERMMSERPPAIAWVINLHRFPIWLNAGRMMRDPVPPAALEIFNPEGELRMYRWFTQAVGANEVESPIGCGVLELGWYEVDMRPEEKGYYTPTAVTPIEQARQFLREGNSSQLWGPGVVIYEGSMNPEQMWLRDEEIPTYTMLGDPILTRGETLVRQRGSRHLVPGTIDVPVKAKFREVVQRTLASQMTHYTNIVNEANDQRLSAEGKEKKWYTSNSIIRTMSQVLFASKRIPKLPEWAIETRVDTDIKEENCRRCGVVRKPKALMCACGWPFDTLEAYREGFIDFEHLAIATLSVEELKEVKAIRKQRDDARKEVGIEAAPVPEKK